MIILLDHGNGNNANLINAINEIGLECKKVSDSNFNVGVSDRLLLPGVGAFPTAVKQLKKSGLWDKTIELVKSQHPLLGICLGYQLLFEKSFEFGEEAGFGFLEGEVTALDDVHMGWNQADTDWYYFAHSYAVLRSRNARLKSQFKQIHFASSAESGSVKGYQFHPERSGLAGLTLLHKSLA